MSTLIRDRPAGRRGGESTCRETEAETGLCGWGSTVLGIGKLKTWDRTYDGLALS